MNNIILSYKWLYNEYKIYKAIILLKISQFCNGGHIEGFFFQGGHMDPFFNRGILPLLTCKGGNIPLLWGDLWRGCEVFYGWHARLWVFFLMTCEGVGGFMGTCENDRCDLWRGCEVFYEWHARLWVFFYVNREAASVFLC
jgi:hypothetical protein